MFSVGSPLQLGRTHSICLEVEVSFLRKCVRSLPGDDHCDPEWKTDITALLGTLESGFVERLRFADGPDRPPSLALRRRSHVAIAPPQLIDPLLLPSTLSVRSLNPRRSPCRRLSLVIERLRDRWGGGHPLVRSRGTRFLGAFRLFVICTRGVRRRLFSQGIPCSLWLVPT